MSRGGRSVRFAEEVPEVPPPPSSPELAEGIDPSTTLGIQNISQDGSTNKPISRDTGLTNQPTFPSDKDLSQDDMLLRSAKRREPSMASTPEPWPQVNEADFDITPANTKLALHDSRTANGNKAEDSRLAQLDPHSERTGGSSSLRSSDINSRDSTRSYLTRKEESPGPPPPSPEGKEGKERNSEESRSARKRESKSRESNTTMPLIEENEEEAGETDAHVRTLVVEVPPLGQSKDEKTQTKGPIRRNVDTFVNIDIPAQTEEELAQDAMSIKAQQAKNGGARRLIIESTVVEEDEEVTTQDEGNS